MKLRRSPHDCPLCDQLYAEGIASGFIVVGPPIPLPPPEPEPDDDYPPAADRAVVS